MRRIFVPLAVVALVAALHPAGADHAIGHTTVFTRIPEPGMPEGIAVRDGVVYVGTHASVRGNSGQGPSKIYRYDLATEDFLGEIAVQGQALNATHGLLSIAFDADDRLYVLDRNPPRLLRFDLTQSPPAQETYATFPELRACRPVLQPPPCAPVTVDAAAFPDYFAFDQAGNAYVTDLEAATIYRVPANAGGAEAEVWFQDPRLNSIFGPNGIAIGPDGMLYFAMTGSSQPETPTQGIIYRLPLVESPAADDLETVFVFPEPSTGPDGIAFGASGRLYVALAGFNQVGVLEESDGTWSEVARFPETPVHNAQQEVPYDLPASIAFDGAGNILVTNQSFFAANPQTWAVLRAYVNDTAFPLVEPDLA